MTHGALRAGIYTKGLWSTSLCSDPWSGQPVFLLAKPIDYTETPSAQLRGPKPAHLAKVKQGVERFSVIRPDAVDALAELQECLTELDFASDEASEVPFHWDESEDNGHELGDIDNDGEEFDIFTAEAKGNDYSVDEQSDDNSEVEDNAGEGNRGLKRNMPCSPIALGPGKNELLDKGKAKGTEYRKWFNELKVGDFACVDVDDDMLPFYVGKVVSIFKFNKANCPAEWKDDVDVAPDTKFAEVHWWEPRMGKFEQGYEKNRLYPAIRQAQNGRCCDHIEVVCESSVMYCFQLLTACKVKKGATVSGIMSKRVLTAVNELKSRPPALLGRTVSVPLQMQTTVDMGGRVQLQLLNGGQCPSFRIESRDHMGGKWVRGTVSRKKARMSGTSHSYSVLYDDGEVSDYDGENGEARDLANEFDLGFFRLEGDMRE